jgi:hypothetical protein
MSQLFDSTFLIAHEGAIQRAVVSGFSDNGIIFVQLPNHVTPISCLMLQAAASSPSLLEGDEVLVWLDSGVTNKTGVVMGRVSLYGEPASVKSPEEFSRLPRTIVLEAQEEIVLRNGRARIRLGANGDIEILGESFSSRCRRVVRFLAPMIKLN